MNLRQLVEEGYLEGNLPLDNRKLSLYVVNKEIRVYKKVRRVVKTRIRTVVIELVLPVNTCVVAAEAIGAKCRASRAVVVGVSGKAHKRPEIPMFSDYDRLFIYRPGELVEPKRPFSTDLTDCCRSGIHFFFEKYYASHYPL